MFKAQQKTIFTSSKWWKNLFEQNLKELTSTHYSDHGRRNNKNWLRRKTLKKTDIKMYNSEDIFFLFFNDLKTNLLN